MCYEQYHSHNMPPLNVHSTNTHESGCSCCQSSNMLEPGAIHQLACSGFEYMQGLTDSQTVNTGNVIHRFISNLPEDKHKETELFCLAITMVNLSKDKLNEIDAANYDKILNGLVKTYNERL